MKNGGKMDSRGGKDPCTGGIIKDFLQVLM